jgi:hypothetical protein
MYTPNHSAPNATMPGQAARGGHSTRRTRATRPSTTEPNASLPKASAPGEKSRPAPRIATNADAHSTTVTPAAVTLRKLGWAWTVRARCHTPEQGHRRGNKATHRRLKPTSCISLPVGWMARRLNQRIQR